MALTMLDAGVLIGYLDAADAHHGTATNALRESIDRGDRVGMPASALAEALVAPARIGATAVDRVRELVARLPIEIVALDADTAARAAALRARHRSLRLPDALVIATAVTSAADVLVTTDAGWPAGVAAELECTIVRL